MMLIDADKMFQKVWNGSDDVYTVNDVLELIDEQPTIDAVPIQFIHEVIEYLTKCRDNAIHEETQCAWDEQRQTLIMLLHEWAAWNECGRTGKYGEMRANDGTD